MDRESNTQKCPVEGCSQYPTSCDYVVGRETKKNLPSKASNNPEYVRVNAPREYLMQQHLSDFNNRSANWGNKSIVYQVVCQSGASEGKDCYVYIFIQQ